MGVHQDKDERRETLEAGVPIVSVSLGDTARFVVGGRDEKGTDAAVDAPLGRCARDGRAVEAALPRRHAHPAGHGAHGTGPGRFNLTFRQDLRDVWSLGRVAAVM